MYQVWMDDRLFAVYSYRDQAEYMMRKLRETSPNAKVEIREWQSMK